jgi:hypothetical protein
MPTFDEVMSRPNLALSWYLMSCYLYYILDQPVLSDSQFDELGKVVLEHWDEIDQHQHKHCLTIEDLKAGTGYAIKYPRMIVGAAEALLIERNKPNA